MENKYKLKTIDDLGLVLLCTVGPDAGVVYKRIGQYQLFDSLPGPVLQYTDQTSSGENCGRRVGWTELPIDEITF